MALCCVKRKQTSSNRLFWQRWHASWCIVQVIKQNPVCQRQHERHHCPLPGDTGEGEPATMSKGDTPSNGEPKARAPCLARAGLVHPVEALAQVRQVLGCDADAGVAYLQERLSILHCRAHS